MKFDYDLFIHNANAEYLKSNHNLRYGQFLMNALSKDYPDIQVPDECDCFYNNNKCPNLLQFLSQLESQQSV